jgi:tetratricopeptide (TPR) repeat protein
MHSGESGTAMSWNVVPGSDEAALLMEAGVIYRDSGRYRQAREVFEGLRALFGAYDAAEVALGTVAFAERDIDGAIAHYGKALELNPRSAFAWAHLAQALIFKREKETAYRYCRKALELDPHGTCREFARRIMEYAEAVKYR